MKAIGKLVGKHIRDDPKGGIKVNPEANIRFLLSEPNPYMTAQQMQESVVATQLCLNNNAFILIVRDENEKPVQLYPVPCVSAEAKYDSSGELFLKFCIVMGKVGRSAMQISSICATITTKMIFSETVLRRHLHR